MTAVFFYIVNEARKHIDRDGAMLSRRIDRLHQVFDGTGRLESAACETLILLDTLKQVL